jgi:maleate isomerase
MIYASPIEGIKMTQTTVRLGVLSPATPNRPHFKSFENILPPTVAIAHEGLGLLDRSYQDLANKENVILSRGRELAAKHNVAGVMLTGGGFVALFNPGIEAKLAAVVGRPVVSAIASAVSALVTLSAKSVLLMTPFDRASNELIKAHVEKLGFQICLGPSFDRRIPGSSLGLDSEQLFDLVQETFKSNPAQAIYFQGATMDPLPIIQHIENRLGVPVVTSNSAMLWHLLSKVHLKCSINGYGKLLLEWPAPH